MDVDFDMSFGIPINATGVGGGAADRMNTDDFEDGLTFTDDDFSFFDRPSANTTSKLVSGAATAIHLPIPSGTPSIKMESGLTPAAGPAPFGLSPPFYGDVGSGLGLHSVTPGHPGSSPWIPSSLAEAFTPRFDGPPPDLMPSSPGKTHSSNSTPATPNVQLSPGSDYASHRFTARFGPSIFDPIPFAVSHRISDGKYASGKFSLSTPLDEEDRTEGWKRKYDAETDPSIGVVRKLKRKCDEQGSRDSKMSPSWVREHDDWNNSPSEDLDASKSEESEDEDVDDSPMVSRPSTPPPAYLPPGPHLLHTQFHHSELLPLSTPLRPPGVAVAPAVIASTAAAASVPTPVSPAAAASEKSKSLEAAAYTVAKEVVENSVWADAWRSNATGPVASGPATEVWQTDVMTVVQLLDCIPALEGPLDIQNLFELGLFLLCALSDDVHCVCCQILVPRRLKLPENYSSSWKHLCSL
jgi:mediator of RNA polymerase II transcription subunit 13